MALFVVGFSAAIWYPVAKGKTYRMLPGRSAAVQALSVMLGAPVSLGHATADRAGCRMVRNRDRAGHAGPGADPWHCCSCREAGAERDAPRSDTDADRYLSHPLREEDTA